MHVCAGCPQHIDFGATQLAAVAAAAAVVADETDLYENCVNTDKWEDSYGYTCEDYASGGSFTEEVAANGAWCADGAFLDSRYANDGADHACCVCGKSRWPTCSCTTFEHSGLAYYKQDTAGHCRGSTYQGNDVFWCRAATFEV